MTDAPSKDVLTHGIGSELNDVRLALSEAADTLVAVSGEDLSQRVQPVKDRLNKMIVRIAVVGQIKAGKSTFANCLTRKIDLLPADVNPWTSVVTQLYFGHYSGKTSGAVFRFFDEDQWDILANRGGRLAALTEGLLEDYKRTELLTEVKAMRTRAEQRLGEEFDGLLGRSHRFSTITPDVMAQYVSAGDEPVGDTVDETEAGRFADITHTAEIFFEQPPFACPACVIDTPGINDPLLIREEITQQSLEDADFFVVVLSAHQSLTKEDLRLIRLLKALDRNRFVIFVNRLDEINDPSASVDQLKDRVSDQLAEHLDQDDIDIVVGSAEWASYAITGHGEFTDMTALNDFVIARRLQDDAAELLDATGLEDNRADAYVASGLREIEAALSDLVLQGSARTHLVSMVDDLLTVSTQVEERLKLRTGQTDDAKTGDPAALTREECDRLLHKIMTQANKHVRTLEAVMITSCDALGGKLSKLAVEFTEDQRQVVRAALAEAGREGDIEIDLDPLREKLTKTYKSGFDEIQGVLWDELKSINSSFRAALPKRVEQPLQTVRIATLPIIGLLPRSSPFNQTVTFDLSKTWLGGIFSSSDRLTEKAIDTIRSQFSEIALDTAEKEKKLFSDTLKETMDQFQTDLQEQLTAVANATDPASIATKEVQEQARDAALRDLTKIQALVDTLTALQQDLTHDNVPA
ncbi:dynamin family protein [Actibacterium sp. 188UL27-1]|uniref:dynamin family protein n=1 Tax=Actibacterium sp. 188UL27-1 TaxID=2786961 RepID=UPI0019571907|nr:dynamin family protein [Actibacterium sp. 188UL27-1]MBM7069117.1 dynamin family protein [Actibacterium sp. 188UL27-1]